MQYLCPLCAGELTKVTKTWSCLQGHQFDCAKEGYVNLLPVQKKNSKDPGDNKEMMQARREFLNQGYYQSLSDAVNTLAVRYAPKAKQILDLGCGEGYYSNRLFTVLTQAQKQLNVHESADCQLQGLDISKTAIRYAAKRYPQMSFCVASAYEMPFPANSVDLGLRIYAPSKAEELARVIADNGILITVSPGPMHHFAIKEMIYKHPKPHPDSFDCIEGFECIDTQRLQSQMSLDNGTDIGHFLNMTPYAWKLTQEQKAQLAVDGLNCELDFHIGVYRRMIMGELVAPN
ncbi:23S rRNA (guanine(745)-N(1))-methyltransferase [Shewanella sp. SR44-3]|uniref:23S rRNA (guanine(745)-N(1))-methyltransferase n=1 Tax=Shewanella sp. SR44-3 TaxID=2760936 RepID=UPI0015F9900B|nr:23S rRNA (guanine(745)-N(1))-methyltransferase [Shewanella sp. SR44-3]MBB1269464.1 23S rRNA (guanine(745)-N(1))-methyltransferase [Shewanella sp. SR44-3]